MCFRVNNTEGFLPKLVPFLENQKCLKIQFSKKNSFDILRAKNQLAKFSKTNKFFSEICWTLEPRARKYPTTAVSLYTVYTYARKAYAFRKIGWRNFLRSGIYRIWHHSPTISHFVEIPYLNLIGGFPFMKLHAKLKHNARGTETQYNHLYITDHSAE